MGDAAPDCVAAFFHGGLRFVPAVFNAVADFFYGVGGVAFYAVPSAGTGCQQGGGEGECECFFHSSSFHWDG
jgi:hypothetical protein